MNRIALGLDGLMRRVPALSAGAMSGWAERIINSRTSTLELIKATPHRGYGREGWHIPPNATDP